MLVKFLLVRARAIKLSGGGKMGTYIYGGVKSRGVRQKLRKTSKYVDIISKKSYNKNIC